VLTRIASIYFLATPLGKKKMSSAGMVGKYQDKSKVDPKNIIDAEYGDVPEDQHNNLEAYLRDYSEDIRKRMAACYGKTR
jgi:hypothetical protein